MKQCLVLAMILLLVPTAPAAGQETPKPKMPAAFEMLQSLVGEWQGVGKEHKGMKISYSLTAGGSALVETMVHPDGSTMTTVYHPDGEKVMLTHYCHVGNQPRMRAAVAEGNKIHFAFVDVTNVSDPAAPYMNDLVLTIPDKNHLTEQWTMRMGEKSEAMTLAFERVK